MLYFLFSLVTLSLVAVTDEPPHSALKLTMRFVKSIIDAELPNLGELAFDPIEPRSIRRCPDEANIVVSCPSPYFWTSVRREIIQNKIDSFSAGIVSTQAFECTKSLLPALALKEVSPELITVDIKERQ